MTVLYLHLFIPLHFLLLNSNNKLTLVQQIFVLLFMKMRGYLFQLCPSHYQALQSLIEFVAIVHITVCV